VTLTRVGIGGRNQWGRISKAGGLPHPSLSPFHSPYILSLPVGGKVRSSEGVVPRLPPYKYHPDTYGGRL